MEPEHAEDRLLGRTIAGKFTLDRYIGGGAMGSVYRARHVQLETIVALKVLHPDLSRDPAFLKRFLQEARTAFRIDHPNSMRVIDFGEDTDGLLYIAMEHLDGPDLYAVLKRDYPLPPERIADIMMQTLGALAAAHDLGIIHRDIKPENIMILERRDDEGNSRDLVKVCDFGIAKMLQEAKGNDPDGPKATARGMIIGTPEYMAPEQGRGEELDARADLYSVGVILYQLLTKNLPFEADTPLAILVKHLTDEVQPPSAIVRNVDPRLETICLRALKKTAEERFPSAREMRAEFRPILERMGRTSTLSGLMDPHLATADTVPPGAAEHGSMDRSERVSTGRTISGVDMLPELDPSMRRGVESLRVPVKTRKTGWIIGTLLIGVTGLAIAGFVRNGSYARLRSAEGADPSASAVGSGATNSLVPTGAPVDPATLSSAQVTPASSASQAPVVSGSAATSTIRPAGNVVWPTPNAKGPGKSPKDPPSNVEPPPPVGTKVSEIENSVNSALDAGVANAAYQPQHAHVDLGSVVGATAKSVKKVVPLSLFSQCLREDLRGVTNAPPPFGVTLSLKTDAQGQVASYSFVGNFAAQHPQDLSGCVNNNMSTGGKIEGVTSASVISAELSFRP